MYPRLKILECIAINNFDLIVWCQLEHRFVSDFAFLVCFSMAVSDHRLEILKFEPSQFHCHPHLFCPLRRKTGFAFTNQFQISRRRKARSACEFSPRKRRNSLALVVKVLHINAVVFVFRHRLHKRKYILFYHVKQHLMILQCVFQSKIMNFSQNFTNSKFHDTRSWLLVIGQ